MARIQAGHDDPENILAGGSLSKYQRVLCMLLGEKTHQWCHPEVTLEWLRKAPSLGLWSPYTCSQGDRNWGGSPQNWGPINGFICMKDNPISPENEVISSNTTNGIFAFLYVGKWISIHTEHSERWGHGKYHTHVCHYSLTCSCPPSYVSWLVLQTNKPRCRAVV